MSAFSKGAAIVAALATMLVVPAYAEDPPKTQIEAPAEPNAIPLNTGGVEGQTAKETWYKQWGDPFVRNVSRATLTPFLPDPAKATGAAVIVAPGGGFRILSMGNEGWEVAKALNDRGVAAFVLKYRLMPTAPDWAEFDRGNPLTAPTPGAAGAGPPPPRHLGLPAPHPARPPHYRSKMQRRRSGSCALVRRNGTSIRSASE